MLPIRSLAVAATMLLAGAAAAQERCEGTLCDLYYGGSAPAQTAPAKPAAPTPLTVPTMSGPSSYLSNFFSRSSDAAPAGQQAAAQPSAAPQGGQREGFFHMGGGGITGQKPAGECGGTICDLMHGHSSDEDSGASVSQSVNGVPVSHYGGETASAEPAAMPRAAAPAPAGAEAPAQASPRRIVVRAEPKPPACALKTSDPWSCYRR